VWVGTLSHGAGGFPLSGTFQHTETYQYQDQIGNAIAHVLRTVPNGKQRWLEALADRSQGNSHYQWHLCFGQAPLGVLCFFPSYSLLEKLVKRWETTGLWAQMASVKTLVVGTM